MAGVNRVALLGQLDSDPELKHTSSGAVCKIRLETVEEYRDKSGAQKQRKEWHTLVAWGQLAERCAADLRKGARAYFEGRLQTRKWEDKQNAKHYSTEVVVSLVDIIDPQIHGGGVHIGTGSAVGNGDDLPF